MAVKIKLQRRGKKKQPCYRIVVQNSRTARDGKVIEIIGLYNPLTDPTVLDINEERAKYWMGTGAKPTDTVERLFAVKGLVERTKVFKKKEAPKKDTKEEAKATPVAETEEVVAEAQEDAPEVVEAPAEDVAEAADVQETTEAVVETEEVEAPVEDVGAEGSPVEDVAEDSAPDAEEAAEAQEVAEDVKEETTPKSKPKTKKEKA